METQELNKIFRRKGGCEALLESLFTIFLIKTFFNDIEYLPGVGNFWRVESEDSKVQIVFELEDKWVGIMEQMGEEVVFDKLSTLLF
jgi:hypothetical protein